MVQVVISAGKGSNRLGYEYPKGEPFTDLSAVLREGSDEEKRLGVISRLLAKQRPNALDHRGSDVQFHAAALVVTEKGNCFVSSNVHAQRTELSRNCAESNVITEALALEGDSSKITHIYFMGDRADYARGKIALGGMGKRYTPCGSCRNVIYDVRTQISPDTLVHILPVNDGTMKLLPGNPDDGKSMNEIEPNRIFTRSISELLPNVSYQLADPFDELKSMIRKGYEWVHDATSWKAIRSAAQQEQLVQLKTHEHLNPDERLVEINQLLMHAAKEYFQASDIAPESVSIAIVRSTDGNYYIGKHLNNGVVPSSPSAELSALDTMLKDSPNARFTDVFLLNVNQKDLAVARDPQGRGDDVNVSVPDGATREILKKFAPQNGAAKTAKDFFSHAMDASGGNVHIFLPSNPESNDFNPQKHVVSLTVKDLLPYAYQNPKSQEVSGPARR